MPSALTGALLALLGGAAALVGQIVVQRLVHAFNRAKDRDAVLREKGEALVMYLLEYRDWFDYQTTEIFGTKEDRPSPLTKVRALQRLYFPTLRDNLSLLYATEVATLHKRNSYRAEELQVGALMYAADEDFGDFIVKHVQMTEKLIDDVCLITQRTLRT